MVCANQKKITRSGPAGLCFVGRQYRLLRLHRLKPVLLGEFVFPAGDYYGGEAVAQDVYGGAAHIH
jgi:hypothetical protein